MQPHFTRSTRFSFLFLTCALCVLAANLPGCLPNRFVIDLAGSDGRLREKRVMADPNAPAAAPKIALIDVEGLISHAPSGGLFAGSGNSVDEIVSRLEKAEEDSAVRAVILRVNSPGGTVAASETLYNELHSFRERSKKPIVVSMAEMAASGGYYISLAADRVIAQPSSITGSIGVIIQTMNFSKGMAMIGIESRVVKSGPNKDIANPFEPIREDQYAVLQGTVNDFYESFRSLVRERRPGIDPSRFDTLTDGRIFTGRQALEAGLVDSVGDLREAFEEAKRLGMIERAQIVKYHTAGRTPASPYALASTPAAPPQSGGDISLRLQLPHAMSLPPGFYYLWSPEAP
ncbi:MAG: signal peptide peptidase SppA [Phycisphaerae bacterium]|nr:signal peptide peptidase SppA [Phycisphaerae bacterium]